MTTIGAILLASGLSILFTATIYGGDDYDSKRGAESSGQRKKPCTTR